MSPGLGHWVSVPRTGPFWNCWRSPFTHRWVREMTQIVPTAPLGAFDGEMSWGQRSRPGGREEHDLCQGAWALCCLFYCKMKPPLSHVPEPARISPKYPSLYLDTLKLWIRPTSRSNPPWVQKLHSFYGDMYFIYNIIFPTGYF